MFFYLASCRRNDHQSPPRGSHRFLPPPDTHRSCACRYQPGCFHPRSPKPCNPLFAKQSERHPSNLGDRRWWSSKRLLEVTRTSQILPEQLSLRSVAIEIHSRRPLKKLPADVFLRESATCRNKLARWLGKSFQPIAERGCRRLSIPRLTACISQFEQGSVTPEMRFNFWQSCGFCSTGSLLRNQQTLRVKIAKIEHPARSTEFGKNVCQILNAICKPVTTAIDHGTETLSLCVPSAVGMPRACILDHYNCLRACLSRATFPAQWLTNNLTMEIVL